MSNQSRKIRDGEGRVLELPKWREDFPYESDNDEFISRRDFVRFLTVVSGGLMLGSGIIMGSALADDDPAPPAADVGTSTDLPPGTSRVVQYPDRHSPVLLVRRANGTLVAYQQKCTHLTCPVDYMPAVGDSAERLVCHCHKGVFDLNDGRGVSGPPRELRPLRRVIVREEAGRIIADGFGPRRI